MEDSIKTPEVLDIERRLDKARAALAQTESEMYDVEDKLEVVMSDGTRVNLLGEIIDRLGELDKLRGTDLFWGEGYDKEATAERMESIRGEVIKYREKVKSYNDQRDQIRNRMRAALSDVQFLREELDAAKEEAEESQFDFVVERDETEVKRRLVMPWSSRTEADKRYWLVFIATMLVTFGFTMLVHYYEVPKPEVKIVKIPERLAKLILEKKKPVEQPKPKEEEKKPEEEKKKKSSKDKATPKQVDAAKNKAKKSGLLAFQDSFSSLAELSSLDKLGAQARVNNAGQQARKVQRSIVASNIEGGSGGIQTSSISRNVGGGSGQSLKGTGVQRVGSEIGTEYVDDERRLSGGPGPSRTDEEIQIVFDRYKSTLYRMYQRELRKNPTLQGKLVIKLTIMPDGSVSKASVQSSDLDAPALEAKIIARVKTFNFGKKEGTKPITILYPIDFLPI